MRSRRPSMESRWSTRRIATLLFLLGCLVFITSQWRLVPSLATIEENRYIAASSLGASSTTSASTFAFSAACATSVAAAPNARRSNPSPAEQSEYVQRLRAQQPSTAPTLSELLAHAPSRAEASVTVILEYTSAAALCRQLRAVVQQEGARADDIWVVALRDPDADGGDEARRVVASFESLAKGVPISVVSSASVGGPDADDVGESEDDVAEAEDDALARSDPSGARSLGRLARFQLALQATSRHVLVLDSGLVPPPTLIATLSRIAAVPEAHGVLGVAGWRSLTGGTTVSGGAPSDVPRADVDDEPTKDELHVSVGGHSAAMPSSAHRLRVDRMVPVDVLRGGWFLRTAWVALLFREAPPTTLGRSTPLRDPPGEEAWLSTMFARHGDLASLLLPTLTDADSGGGSAAALIPDDPSPAQEAAWRRQLWDGVRRGDPPAEWRNGHNGGLSAAHATPASVGAWGFFGDGADSSGPRRVVLIVVESLRAAAALAPLYAALSAGGSMYDPRLVLAPTATLAGGCAAVSAAMNGSLSHAACRRAESVYVLRGNVEHTARSGDDGEAATSIDGHLGGQDAAAFYTAAAAAEAATACGAMQMELERLVRAADPVLLIAPTSGSVRDPLCSPHAGVDMRGPSDAERARAQRPLARALPEAVRAAASEHGSVVLLEPPLSEVAMLEWIAVLPPSALARWHEPSVEIAVIAHRRPRSLTRLLRSMSCAHYLGDRVDVTFSLEAGADDETSSLARSWLWAHGDARTFPRVANGGLIAAVVESWTPSSEHSYSILLEDDIEVSPFFYVYAKLLLLRHVYADARAGGGGGTPPDHLLGISLYTPRLVELTMPRRHIDLYAFVGPASRVASASGAPNAGALYLQQLPCSWGQLFFPRPWMAFRAYMRRRLDGDVPAVNIANSACCQGTRWGNGGWSMSWKKFLIELAYLKGYVVLYPNFANQTSLSTNHLEPGEHIHGKANALKHRPIDFTVPLLDDFASLRQLWTTTAAVAAAPRPPLAPLLPLRDLPTLDLFSEVRTQDALVASGEAQLARNPAIAAAIR